LPGVAFGKVGVPRFGVALVEPYRAIASGELSAARVCGGSRLLVPAEEARAWVARNLMAPQAPIRSSPEVASARGTRSTPLKDALGGRVA
jgi:hypothetical protein